MGIWDEVVKGAGTGAVAAGLPTLGVGAIPGAIVGGVGGLIKGLLDDEKGPAAITATPEQSAAFEREKALREDAIKQAQQMGGAAARDKAQKGALLYGAAGMGREGRLAGLRDIDVGAEGARQQAALEATIFAQEASPEAARQKKIAWLEQQIQSRFAAGHRESEDVLSLMPMAGGDPQVVAYLNQRAASAPGNASLAGDIGNIFGYITSGAIGGDD